MHLNQDGKTGSLCLGAQTVTFWFVCLRACLSKMCVCVCVFVCVWHDRAIRSTSTNTSTCMLSHYMPITFVAIQTQLHSAAALYLFVWSFYKSLLVFVSSSFIFAASFLFRLFFVCFLLLCNNWFLIM